MVGIASKLKMIVSSCNEQVLGVMRKLAYERAARLRGIQHKDLLLPERFP
jgi:hypothetical protein